MSSRIRLSVAVIASLCLLAAGASSASAGHGKGQEAHRGGPADPDMSLRLKGLHGGKLTVGKDIVAKGTVRPFVAGQKVTVTLQRGKKTVKTKKVFIHRKNKTSKLGQFDFQQRLVRPGKYKVEASHAKNPSLGHAAAKSRKFSIRYPDLGPGDSGRVVKIFNELLAKQGYVNDENAIYDSATGRAVLAYHKVNDESRTEKATKGMFKKLAKGKGGFKLKHPGAGKHVEADISRQVMVLAKHGEAKEIYTISSGKATTPTILGKFRFYRKEPGFNSHAMYYSVYFKGGYATHGYASVPDYPASHGCLRNPIPDSHHIYNWIDLGDVIYVYR
jgi:hypothetical protein